MFKNFFDVFKVNKQHNIPFSYYTDNIEKNIITYIDYLRDVRLPDSFINYVEAPDLDYSYNSKVYKEMVATLRNIKEENNLEIFISFVGLPKNHDCVDNFSHSRYLRKKDDKIKYDLLKRSWYIEMINDSSELMYTTPYLAESGSYVLSIIRKLYNKEGNYIGVLGIDVLLDSLARVKNGDNIIIFDEKGKIYFNSHVQFSFLLEKQNNILHMIPFKTFQRITTSNNMGVEMSEFCGNKQSIEFQRVLNNKAFFIKTEHIHIDNKSFKRKNK